MGWESCANSGILILKEIAAPQRARTVSAALALTGVGERSLPRGWVLCRGSQRACKVEVGHFQLLCLPTVHYSQHLAVISSPAYVQHTVIAIYHITCYRAKKQFSEFFNASNGKPIIHSWRCYQVQCCSFYCWISRRSFFIQRWKMAVALPIVMSSHRYWFNGCDYRVEALQCAMLRLQKDMLGWLHCLCFEGSTAVSWSVFI